VSNAVDPSGKRTQLAEINARVLVTTLNRGLCSSQQDDCDGIQILGFCIGIGGGGATPTPTPTPQCGGYILDNCDQIYLAHVSAAEASTQGTIISNAGLAAVMLSQINRFRRGGQFYGIGAGTSYITSGAVALSSQRQHLDTLIANGIFSNLGIDSIGDINVENQYRVYRRICQDGALVMPNPPGFQTALRMASAMSCTSNPLSNFNFSSFGITGSEQGELQKIAGNTNFSEEKSFCTSILDVLDEWQAPGGFGEQTPNLIPNGFPDSVALFRGPGGRSLMVHDAFAFGNPHVNWQCDQAPGERMVWLVTNNTSSPLTGRVACRRCEQGTFNFTNGFVTDCTGEDVNTC